MLNTTVTLRRILDIDRTKRSLMRLDMIRFRKSFRSGGNVLTQTADRLLGL